MKHITLFLLIITLVLISCKKSDPAADITGTYDFTVTARSWSVVMGSRDTVIYYSGSISRVSSHTIKICYTVPNDTTSQFRIPGVIYPYINDKGILSYPDFTNTYLGSYFISEQTDHRTVQFSIGEYTNGYTWSNGVTGKKR